MDGGRLASAAWHLRSAGTFDDLVLTPFEEVIITQLPTLDAVHMSRTLYGLRKDQLLLKSPVADKIVHRLLQLFTADEKLLGPMVLANIAPALPDLLDNPRIGRPQNVPPEKLSAIAFPSQPGPSAADDPLDGSGTATSLVSPELPEPIKPRWISPYQNWTAQQPARPHHVSASVPQEVWGPVYFHPSLHHAPVPATPADALARFAYRAALEHGPQIEVDRLPSVMLAFAEVDPIHIPAPLFASALHRCTQALLWPTGKAHELSDVRFLTALRALISVGAFARPDLWEDRDKGKGDKEDGRELAKRWALSAFSRLDGFSTAQLAQLVDIFESTLAAQQARQRDRGGGGSGADEEEREPTDAVDDALNVDFGP
mmetsp:Transcript_42034/g.104952  ORF Transcript_42034/g.104952 Transcript_42034/m.104952 type:complete len:372 (-) Transcript_42034:249-1364(-)